MYETRKKHYQNLPKYNVDTRNHLINMQNDSQYQDYILENYIDSNSKILHQSYGLVNQMVIPRRRIAQKVSTNIIIANFIHHIHTYIKSLIYSCKFKVKQL